MSEFIYETTPESLWKKLSKFRLSKKKVWNEFLKSGKTQGETSRRISRVVSRVFEEITKKTHRKESDITSGVISSKIKEEKHSWAWTCIAIIEGNSCRIAQGIPGGISNEIFEHPEGQFQE